jgi:hypothetical protein
MVYEFGFTTGTLYTGFAVLGLEMFGDVWSNL